MKKNSNIQHQRGDSITSTSTASVEADERRQLLQDAIIEWENDIKIKHS